MNSWRFFLPIGVYLNLFNLFRILVAKLFHSRSEHMDTDFLLFHWKLTCQMTRITTIGAGFLVPTKILTKKTTMFFSDREKKEPSPKLESFNSQL